MLALIATLKNKQAIHLTFKHFKTAKEVYKSFWPCGEFTDEEYLERLIKHIIKSKCTRKIVNTAGRSSYHLDSTPRSVQTLVD